MGYKLNPIFSLLIVILTFAACRKDQLILISSETVNQRFKEGMEWNSKHPYPEIVVPADDYFLLSMADSHVGGTNNLDSFFDIAKTTNATAVVMAGDLTTGHLKDYNVFEHHLLPQDSLSSFLIVGNHDLYFNGWEEFYARFGSSSYLFTIKTPVASDLFICLDTGGGTLGDEQLDWLINILQTSRPNYRRCMVFTHTNLFRTRHDLNTIPPVEELRILLDLFTKHRVDIVITGHGHEHDVNLFGITTYITMDALEDGLSNSGYSQIRVRNGNIEYKFENI